MKNLERRVNPKRLTVGLLVALSIAVLGFLLWKHKPSDRSNAAVTAGASNTSVSQRAGHVVSLNEALEFSNHLPAPARMSAGNATQVAPDLRKLFDEYLKSDDGDQLRMARSILTDCAGEMVYDHTYSDIASGRVDRLYSFTPPLSAPEIAAIKHEVNLCKGFEGMQRAEAMQDREDLERRLSGSQSPMNLAERAFMDPANPPSPEGFAAILASKDGVALEFAANALALNWRLHQSADVDPEETENVSDAITLLGCDFGDDCSLKSRGSSNICLKNPRNCGKTYEDFVFTDKTEKQKAAIQAYRRVFDDALRTGDYRVFGLP